MAGIIIALGDEINRHIGKIRQEFEILKDLKASYEFCDKKCQIIKYKRKYDEEDNNYFESSDIVLCAVGTIIYRNYGIEESIREVGKALSNSVRVSEITDEIDGHYCLAIIDKKKKRCQIITDAGGFINTYIFKKYESYFISTSMLALAKTFPVTPQLESILMFLRSGIFFDDTTYFNETKTLEPASVYQYDFESRQLTREEYWSVPKEVDERISFKDAADRIIKSLNHIVDAIPNEKAVYDFTGGYDARFVLSFAFSKEKDKNRINTFFFGPPSSREAKIVEQNCLNLGMKYNNYVVQNDWPEKYFDCILESNNLSDGLENACAYASVLWVQKKKRADFSFAVNGLFGELYRQRRWITEFGRRGQRRAANLRRLIRYRELTEDFDESIFSGEHSHMIRNIPDQIINVYERTNKIFDHRVPNTLQLDNIYFAQKARRWGGRNVSTANQLIQTICPLWFRKPLEISMALPPKYKLNSKLMRYIVEKETPRFAKQKMITGAPFVQINLNNIYKFLPSLAFFSQIAIRKFSQVFFNKTIWAGLTTPDYNIGEWYREALKNPRCQDLLTYDKMLSKCFYDKKKFNEFIQRARTQEFHFYTQIGRIITVELTLRSSTLREDVNE